MEQQLKDIVWLCFNFSISSFWRPVILWESLQLQGIKCILATSNILHCIFSSTTLTGEKKQAQKMTAVKREKKKKEDLN